MVFGLLMQELKPLAVTTPALFTLFGTQGGPCPDGHVAALFVLWSPSEPSTAAFLELLCSLFAAPESMDGDVC